jgi:hypothetical protein
VYREVSAHEPEQPTYDASWGESALGGGEAVVSTPVVRRDVDMERIQQALEELEGLVALRASEFRVNEERGEWMMIIDPATGRTFFHNRVSGEAQWGRPTGWVRMMAKSFDGRRK